MVSNSKIIWNPYSPDYFRNPYPHLNACRESNPIQVGLHDSWIFFKYNHVSEIIRSQDFLVSDLSGYLKTKEPYIFGNNGCPYLAKGTQKWLLYLNGDEHKQARAIVGKAFKEFNLKVAISEATEQVIKKFESETEFDGIDFCSEFLFFIMKKFYNIHDDYTMEEIKIYSNRIARAQDMFVTKQVYQEINKWFLWGNDMFNHQGNDAFNYKQLIEDFAKNMQVEFSEENVLSILSLSLMAAFETSKDNLVIAINEFLTQPNLMEEALSFDENQISLLTEEIFRFCAPVHYTIRINKNKLQFNDIEIPAQSRIYVCLASANRDADEFQNPDSFISLRNPNEHLTFGAGSHLCLGASIARQEIRICIKPMIEFLKNYLIDSSKELKYGKQILLRTIESLPIKKKS